MGGLVAPRRSRAAVRFVARLLARDRPRADDAGKRSARRLLPPRAAGQCPLPGRRRAGVAHRSRRSVHLAGRARRDAGHVERHGPHRRARGPLDVQLGAPDPLLPGSVRIQPLPAHTGVAGRLPAGAGAREAIRPMSARAALGMAGAQAAVPADHPATYRADSLRLTGRPWHAAETLLAEARRDPNPNAFLIVEGAKAEVNARRYEHARALLVNQPWLADYLDGEALAVLAQAEFGVGRFPEAATHFQMARARAPAPRRPLLAVRAGLAFDAAGQPDSAAAALAAARSGGALASIETRLRVREEVGRAHV